MRRWLGLLILVGACGSDDGALLTFEAPGGPDGASRVQIVLASADPQTIGTGVRQRVQPGTLGSEDVVYYRQRARGGIVDAVTTLDGFQVRIEPELDAAPDEQFIPFALIFDDAGELAAVGAVHDAEGNPMPVSLREGALVKYTMTITPVAFPGADAALAANQGLVVGCLDAHEEVWTSGFAWRPATGPQLRLLLADQSEDPAASDATARLADLDCDAFDATDDDCDDLRSAYHPGQPETCDGLDTDCDGRRMEVQSCMLPVDQCGGTGVSLCVDQGANVAASACQPDPACACADAQGSCARCVIDTIPGVGVPARSACSPAIGKLHISNLCGSTCTVEVAAVDGPFEVTLSALELGPFMGRATAVPGAVYIRAKRATLNQLPTPTVGFASLGKVYLAISVDNRTIPFNVDLEISEDLPNECTPAPAPENSWMNCQP